jgi:hypothetical protein
MATCPICSSDAEEIVPSNFSGKIFSCGNHGRFGATRSALKEHKVDGLQRWEATLEKARARAGSEMPTITTYDF